MRFKKSMSVFLSLLLFLSIIFPSGTIASASETTENSEIVSVSENLEPVENEAVQTLEAETQEAEQKEAENVQEENDQVNVAAEEDTEPVENDPVQTSESETQEAEQKETANVQEENDQVNAAAKEDAVSEEKEGSSENNGELKEDEQMQEPTKGDTVPVDKTLDSEASEAVEITEPEKNTDLSEKLQDENTVSDDVPAQEEEAETDPISTNEDEAADENVNMVDVPQGRSLLPLKEIEAYLILSGYTEQELTSMPVDTMLSLLKDSEGETVSIEKDATTIWRYILDDSGIETYEEYSIGNDEKINLYPGDGVESFQMEIIVGNDGQLNPKNKRYIIYVELTDNFEEDLDVEIYIQDSDENRIQAVPENCNEWTFMYSDGVTEETVFDLSFGADFPGALSDHGTVLLNIKSKLAEDPRVDIKIYPVLVYDFGYVTIKKDIASQILNQDMGQLGTGYQISGEKNTDETFQMVTYINGVEYSSRYIGVRYWNWYPRHEGKLFVKDNNQKNEVYENITTNFDAENKVSEITFKLKDNLSASDSYYFDYDFVMQKNYGENSGEVTNYDGLVKKVVIGHYDSIEEAEEAGAKDITGDILRNGYLSRFDGKGLDITVFKHYRLSQSFPLIYDTLADKVNIKVVQNKNAMRDYTEAPVIGETDPWFRVTGANDAEGNAYNTYIVENGKNINIDTMYGYGYQTVFVNEDIESFVPTFWKANDEAVSIDRIYANGREFQEGSELWFPDGENMLDVTFSVIITDKNGSHSKNYDVTFVKKASGSQLYVAGPLDPDVRSVFLDEYFEFKHDIFIANVGDEPLTGLRVELNATNVKLDDYWTVGGENNDTLAPFTTVSSTTEYGELPNVAKIRLLPDGDGEIDGTLTIYADGQEPVVIKLSGRAQNPKITTSDLDEAVKYVPYSYMVTTNNMYDWTDVEFTMTGELPEGVEFIKSTGEIYGVPQETGEFPISVTANFKSDTYQFESSSVDLTLKVKDNTNTNVYEATDEGYEILDSIGSDETGTYDFVLTEDGDQMFVSNGEFDNFVDLWLNGEKLIEGEDYTKVAGSTRITIRSQTFKNKANQDGYNTIAAEFRESDSENNELRRTAQNFRLNLSSTTDPDEGTTDPDEGTTNPGGGTTDPDGDTTNPGGGTTNPGGGTTNPGGGTTNPGGGTSNPGEGTTNPGGGTTNPGGGTTNPGGSTTNSGGSATNSDENITNVSVNDEVTDNKEQNVEILVNLVDADDNPLAGYTVEIHSTPQSKITDEEGQARFREIEFGKHTVYVKNSSGEILAQKDLVVQQGKTLALSGDTITADYGTKFALKIQLDEGQLSFILVQNVTETGDSNNITLWLSLFVLSGLFLTEAVIWYMKRVRNNRREEI